jgi:hypothetical protein
MDDTDRLTTTTTETEKATKATNGGGASINETKVNKKKMRHFFL